MGETLVLDREEAFDFGQVEPRPRSPLVAPQGGEARRQSHLGKRGGKLVEAETFFRVDRKKRAVPPGRLYRDGANDQGLQTAPTPIALSGEWQACDDPGRFRLVGYEVPPPRIGVVIAG